MRAASCCNTVFTAEVGTLTFSRRQTAQRLLAIAIKAQRISSHGGHDFKTLAIPLRDTLLLASPCRMVRVLPIYIMFLKFVGFEYIASRWRPGE